eukprot:520605-Pyramimonas_sp.AAC.1
MAGPDCAGTLRSPPCLAASDVAAAPLTTSDAHRPLGLGLAVRLPAMGLLAMPPFLVLQEI